MEKKYKIGLGITMAFVFIGFVATVVSVFDKNMAFTVSIATDLAIYIAVFYYAIWGYKKPHGNLLRYAMLLFAFNLMFSVMNAVNHGAKTSVVLFMVAMILVAYVSGRLNKFEKNKYLMIIILLVLIFAIATNLTAPKMPTEIPANSQLPPKFIGDNGERNISLRSIIIANCAITWNALSSAYFTRYLEHKEAGLEG